MTLFLFFCSPNKVEKLLKLKKEHKQFKRENKKMKETIANLMDGGRGHSRRSQSSGDSSAAVEQANYRIEELQRQNEQLQSAVEETSSEREQLAQMVKVGCGTVVIIVDGF